MSYLVRRSNSGFKSNNNAKSETNIDSNSRNSMLLLRFVRGLSSRSGFSFSQSPLSLLCRACMTGLVMFALIRLYYEVELLITDPYLEAGLYYPLRTFHVKFVEPKIGRIMRRRLPIRTTRTFTMTEQNAFVIHLLRDQQRWNQFQAANQGPAASKIQVFAATDWQNEYRKDDNNNNNNHTLFLAMKDFAWLRYASKRGQYGDAGCTLSHIRLLQQLLRTSTFTSNNNSNSSNNSKEDPYYFVLEDDVHLHAQLLQYGNVTAPSDAHVVFLVPTSTKRVRVPIESTTTAKTTTTTSSDSYAIRVLQGYGAYGYIITRSGAQILLEHLRRHAVAIDVALAGGARDLRVYHPLQVGTQPTTTRSTSTTNTRGEEHLDWVQHRPGQSTRRQHNGDNSNNNK